MHAYVTAIEACLFEEIRAEKKNLVLIYRVRRVPPRQRVGGVGVIGATLHRMFGLMEQINYQREFFCRALLAALTRSTTFKGVSRFIVPDVKSRRTAVVQK